MATPHLPPILIQSIPNNLTSETREWATRFRNGRKQLLLDHEWRLLIHALGSRLLRGLSQRIFDDSASHCEHFEAKDDQKDQDPDTLIRLATWKTLRIYRETIQLFIQNSAYKLPYLQSFEAWTAFSIALRATAITVINRTEEASKDTEEAIDTKCIFTDSHPSQCVRIQFMYVQQDPITKIDHPAVSPYFSCSRAFLPMIHAWMIIGQSELLLTELIHDAISSGPDDDTTLASGEQLLQTAIQNNTELREAIEAINHSAYFLFHINQAFRSFKRPGTQATG